LGPEEREGGNDLRLSKKERAWESVGHRGMSRFEGRKILNLSQTKKKKRMKEEKYTSDKKEKVRDYRCNAFLSA